MPDESLYSKELSELQRFQLVVTSIRDYAIYMLDPQGFVTSWNAGAERFKGYTATEILGSHFSRFFTSEDQEADVPGRALQIAIREGKFEGEGWRLRKDGRKFWASSLIDPIIADNGQLLGFAKMTRDITEKKLAAEALQASEQQFRLLIQGVTDYAIYMLTPDGTVSNWNIGAQHIKGYTESEVVGTHFSRFYTDEDRVNGVPGRALATATAEGRYEQEGLRLRKDGTTFWAHVVIDAIRNELGELVGFAKVTRDVTERRNASIALEQANMALFHSQKMEALGKLTGGVAHDFNNLLAVASSALELLITQFPQIENARSLDSIRRAISRGANLTQQLLSFSRQQPLHTEHCDINKAISDFESVLRNAGNSSIHFDFRMHAGRIPVLLDVARFETALLNLVVNAAQAMPEGGKLTVATRMIELAEKSDSPLSSGSYAEIRVTDTGIGMTDEVKSRVFEPFFTTKEAGKGTGLGLSQVYGFIAQSGGDIVVDSQPGVGSTFTIYLPLDHNYAQASERETSPCASALIVDDQLDLLDVTAELFRTLGYETFTATNGTEAMDVLERVAGIDVLFSDVMLPNSVSGIELARLVRQQYPSTKIILTSGYPLPGLAGTHCGISEFSFLNKPYQLTELAAALREKH